MRYPRIPLAAEIMKKVIAFLTLLSPSALPERVDMRMDGKRAKDVSKRYEGMLSFVSPKA